MISEGQTAHVSLHAATMAGHAVSIRGVLQPYTVVSATAAATASQCKHIHSPCRHGDYIPETDLLHKILLDTAHTLIIHWYTMSGSILP